MDIPNQMDSETEAAIATVDAGGHEHAGVDVDDKNSDQAAVAPFS